MKKILLLLSLFVSIHCFALNSQTPPSVELTQLPNHVKSLLGNPNPYQGKQNIVFKKSKKGLSVEIKTDRLVGRYLTEKDIEDIVEIYGSPQVMAKYSKGSPYPREHAVRRAKGWIKTAKEGNPWTAIRFEDPKTGDFCVIFAEPDYLDGQNPTPGDLELTYFAPVRSWNKGYTKEAVAAYVESYIAKLLEDGFKVEGAQPSRLHLSCRGDNPASIRLAVSAAQMDLVGYKDSIIDPNDGTNWGSRFIFAKDLK